MEFRKLQATAGGTFIITVPKEWAAKLQLKKGDLVRTELDEGSLVITPTNSPARASGQQTRVLDIDELRDKRFLELSIVASYIQGHDVTKVFSSSNRMLPWMQGMDCVGESSRVLDVWFLRLEP